MNDLALHISWWYGWFSGVERSQGQGPLGTSYLVTPTPVELTLRYLRGGVS